MFTLTKSHKNGPDLDVQTSLESTNNQTELLIIFYSFHCDFSQSLQNNRTILTPNSKLYKTVHKINGPDTVLKIDGPEIVYKIDRTEAVQKMGGPETVHKMDVPETVQRSCTEVNYKN